MKVMRFTDKDGRQFHNADYCNELIGETVRRLNYQCQIEVIDMTEAEYCSIPATCESAELFRESR